MLRLSQGQLNLLETCPRKFQYVYIDQLATPTTPEQQERMSWGSRFHLLMQQQELGLAIDPLTTLEDEQDKPLWQCVNALIQAAPELFQPNLQGDSTLLRQSEHQRSLEWQGYLFTVIYDLLVLDSQQAQILDWKTYPRPQQPHWLAKNWQTRLYLFVLAETSDYAPEQISMTYWFVEASTEQTPTPKKLKFPYSQALHHQTQKDLSHLLNQLNQWLENYQAGTPFPQVDVSGGICDGCTFGLRCQRGQTGEMNEPLPALVDIEEIVL